ncbi:hypothetical protein CPT03_07455 [Pedobacter ginsengisoli]|uniref:eCIS core domain-containing protein n=1 Tax=Pedobacter ginsengisoli TaxID=363852 RepID=A0A2D1U3Y0_9SPHI|nr:DUF4157 domain-containing protein [Pedobacter ginsengisoli]ATP56320.1 hypothetical protein CPT03_07455 [Pedobacter ginsengisoli]
MKGTSGSHETVNQQTKVADTPKAASLQNENNQPNSTNELVYHNQPKLKAEVSDQIEASRGSGTQMDGDTQSFMESRFGTGFSDVNIHVGTDASQLSNSLNAKAFTVGKDIYFNENMYHPNSAKGKHLLAHELTHTIQQNGNTIQRSPMPGEDTVQNLESYDAATRQNIHYDIGFNLQTNISLFFQKGIVRDVRSGYNVTYVVKGFDPAEAWVESAMRALILYNFNLNKDATDAAITNITTVQHLDLSGETNPSDAKITGPNAMVRFTSTEFDATGKGAKKIKNVQLAVEKLSNFTAKTSTETSAQRRQRYETTYQITNAVPVRNDPLGDPPDTMSDAKFDQVLEALDIVPTGILSKATGIPIHLGQTPKGPKNESAEYSQIRPKGSTDWKRRITVYGDFFSATLPQKAFIMAHEFGHALDFRPNEGSGGKGGESISADKAKGSFREALGKDGGLGKGMSEYAATKTSESEYFAEAFSLYINQPATLKALRPNIYAYFLVQYP